MAKTERIALRIDADQLEQIRSIALEGNVSMWIRELIRKELIKLKGGELK